MKLLHYILFPLILLAIVSCSDYESYSSDVKLSSIDTIYVDLTLETDDNSITRAVPNGGEEGDGWEYGLKNENKLHDFTVFVLNGGKTVNSDASTTFAGYRYFTEAEVAAADSIRYFNLQLKKYDVRKDILNYKFSIPILKRNTAEEPAGYRFLIVANCGDLTQTYLTLGALRNGIPSKTWSVTADGTAERFVMSNENDNYYVLEGSTEDNPYNLHVTIERMAARIDYNPAGATLVEGTPRYDVKGLNPGNEVLSQLYVDRIAIVNGSQKPSYFFKRVADDINGTNLVYLGDETPTPNGISTNYVIDPYSAQKTDTPDATAPNTTLLTTLFGDSRIAKAANCINSASPISLTTTNWPYIVGYVNENTFNAPLAWSHYATGVVVQCRYAPQKHFYTDYNAETDVLTEGTYTLGQTFYMVEPNTSEIDESQRLYFQNQADAEAYAINTAKKHFGKVVEYTNGVCYYFTYMRHSNNVDVIHNTMEFGIVRNNLYRFTINAATGPGTPTPDPRHPEELKARVYVKKWLSVEHPIIYV